MDHITQFQVMPSLLVHVWCSCRKWAQTIDAGFILLPVRHG